MRGSDVSAMTGECFCGDGIVLFGRLDLGNMETIKELGRPVIGISILDRESHAKNWRPARVSRRRSGGENSDSAEEFFIGICKVVTDNW